MKKDKVDDDAEDDASVEADSVDDDEMEYNKFRKYDWFKQNKWNWKTFLIDFMKLTWNKSEQKVESTKSKVKLVNSNSNWTNRNWIHSIQLHWLIAVYKQNLYISSHESYWIQVMHNHVMFNCKDKDIIIILSESNSLNNLSCNNNNEIQYMKWEYQYENYFKCSNAKSNQW